MYSALADASRLQAICNRCLNSVISAAGGSYRIEPVTGLNRGIVNIQLLRYPKIYSVAPGHESFGYTSQNEMLVSFPVVKKNALGLPVAVGMFAPFLWVDNAWSLITGRDVVGFAKTIGDFTVPAKLWQTNGCIVRTLGSSQFNAGKIDKEILLQTHQTTAMPFKLPISAYSAQPPGSRDDDQPFGLLPDEQALPLWPFGDIDALYASEQLMGVEATTIELMKASAGLSVRSYTLKQLRDGQQPGKACYQAVVEGRTTVNNFRYGGLLPESVIRLSQFKMPNIIDQLGLVAQGDEIKPLFGFWYESGFRLGSLANLAEHCGGQSNAAAGGGCLELATLGLHTTLRFYRGMASAWLRALDSCAPPPRCRNQD